VTPPVPTVKPPSKSVPVAYDVLAVNVVPEDIIIEFFHNPKKA
jgi:hypothetical protein